MQESNDILNKEELEDFYDYDDMDLNLNKFLSFKIDNVVYGFDIQYIADIIEIRDIIPIPDMPHFIKGVINLRGVIIPVMDIRLRLKKEEIDYDNRTCIINLNLKEMTIGVIVDTVSEVLRIPQEKITQPPKFKDNDINEFVNGIGKLDDNTVIIILSPEKILYGKELDELKKAKDRIDSKAQQ
jgi:purine-binding chemotaxis protein CheW